MMSTNRETTQPRGPVDGSVEYRNRYCGSKFPHEAHEHSMVGGVIFRCKGKVSR